MAWPLEARRSLFPDWLWLCDESSPHRRALHIPVQILAGKFKMELLPTISLTKAFPECAEPFYVVMTHHTAKANLEKGSSWPPEAIPYGVPHTRGLVLTQPISPTPWTRPKIPLGPSPPLTIQLLSKDVDVMSPPVLKLTNLLDHCFIF